MVIRPVDGSVTRSYDGGEGGKKASLAAMEEVTPPMAEAGKKKRAVMELKV